MQRESKNHTNMKLEENISWIQPVLFAALAGGMAWGIRGQYGHETGAMIAGLLVSLTLVLLLCPKISLTDTVRATAWCTVAMGFGGSMTYGQTVGLTHDPSLVGNWEALRWGMLGLSIKGGLWIGFAGLFLGMGLGGKRYRYQELFFLMLAAIGAYYLGIYLLNSPTDKDLPAMYFSAHWYWNLGAGVKPRFECWGGLLFALIVFITYTAVWRRDPLAPRLAFWGVLGGAIGFPLGQSLQAYHAWNVEWFRDNYFWSQLDPYMNWWNMMETTFGATMGGMLGFGLWLSRKRIRPVDDTGADSMPYPLEWTLLAIHIPLLIAVEFLDVRIIDLFYDPGLILGLIPIIAIAGGRWWPYLIVFPVTLIPIAGKTVRQLVYQEAVIDPARGWFVYLIIPLLLAIGMADWFKQQSHSNPTGHDFAQKALLFNTWLYFLINYAFFHFPWPWTEWTSRTPNGIIFTFCALGLTIAALFCGRGKSRAFD